MSLFDISAAQATLTQHESAISEALGDAAPAFWGQVAQAMQDIEKASDPARREATVGRLETLCRRHPAVWSLVAPATDSSKPERRSERDKEEHPMTTPPDKPTTSKPSSGPTLESWLTALREIVTASLGITIILTTLAFLVAAVVLFLFRPNAEFALLRDLLVMLNGMAGVVLGYYFGRIPAEARAGKAETERAAAEKQATALQAGMRALAADLDRQAQAAPVAKGLPTPNPYAEASAKIRQLLVETSR